MIFNEYRTIFRFAITFTSVPKYAFANFQAKSTILIFSYKILFLVFIKTLKIVFLCGTFLKLNLKLNIYEICELRKNNKKQVMYV